MKSRTTATSARWQDRLPFRSVYVGKFFASHESVDHSKSQYRKGDCYTNTVEDSFSMFKRGMKGIYQHCGGQHLLRYLAECDFRYSTAPRWGSTIAFAPIAPCRVPLASG